MSTPGTRRSCLILTTPRSGSWLLSEALHATDLVGEPHEYFNRLGHAGWVRDFGLRPDVPFDEFVEAAVRWGTGKTGIFSAKLHWNQFALFLWRLRRLPGDWPKSDAAMLQHFFPDPHFVHLVRRDTARQAISWWRANQTDAWWDLGNQAYAGPTLEPDFRQIRWMEDLLERNKREWRDLLADNDLPCLDLVYEEFVHDRLGTVRRILDFLGVEVGGDLTLPPPRLQKQSDAMTEEWLVAYELLRDSLPPLPDRFAWDDEAAGLVALDADTALPTGPARAGPEPVPPSSD
jgi:LPS sulfotransferase NodH